MTIRSPDQKYLLNQQQLKIDIINLGFIYDFH